MQRLTSEFWVQAYMRRLQLHDIPVYLSVKGDPTAGTVIVKLATLDGNARAFERRYDYNSDQRIWAVLTEGAEYEVDEALARARSRDRDLWIIEIEDRQGRTLLDEEGLAHD